MASRNVKLCSVWLMKMQIPCQVCLQLRLFVFFFVVLWSACNLSSSVLASEAPQYVVILGATLFIICPT